MTIAVLWRLRSERVDQQHAVYPVLAGEEADDLVCRQFMLGRRVLWFRHAKLILWR